MKVLNLRCTHDHAFEGWFASEEDHVSQAERGLIECPMCGDKAVTRMPSAPRLNVSKQRDPVPAGTDDEPARQQQRQWLRAVRHLIDHTEDVGERFPEEARRIHYGEVQNRGIRGRASPEDADALREEGIEVMAIPVPEALKGPVQ